MQTTAIVPSSYGTQTPILLQSDTHTAPYPTKWALKCAVYRLKQKLRSVKGIRSACENIKWVEEWKYVSLNTARYMPLPNDESDCDVLFEVEEDERAGKNEAEYKRERIETSTIMTDAQREIQNDVERKPVDLNIIQVYAPTANSNDEDLDIFYNELDTAKTQCKSQDPLIIMGDFNAKVGTEKVDDIVGKHGLGIRNEGGEKLIEWCQTNNTIVGNTWFQQPPRRKWTWKSPGDETRNQMTI
ncbi:craniofacial development protein 2-like [Plakobranchus ocellatus]|uniref:Craniofacial development protein 2-like n=1 Tax=Plakobranchus ocellatus TaxID=259542 RepID=A0AAV3YFK5_9GAST|nr:craniofacial development protein 2-like [Plakobranchus ocellatus]